MLEAIRTSALEPHDFHRDSLSKTLINCRVLNVCPIIAEIPLDELPSVVQDVAQRRKKVIVMTGVVVCV